MAVEFYKIAEKIDMFAQEYAPENLAEIEKFFDEKGLEYYFFIQRLMEIEEPLAWLIPLKEKGYFDGKKNPQPQEVKEQPGFYTMPFWKVLKYLERVAKTNKENPSDDITVALVDIFNSIISYRDEKGERIDNYRTDWFITKIIFMLPYEIWNEGHFDFISTALRTTFGGSLIQSEIGKSVLPALIDNKAVKLILKLLEVIFGFTKASDEKRDKIKPVMDKHWLRDALKKFKKDIAELCGLEAAKIAISTIKKVLKEDEGRFSYIWMPTIEDSSQNKFPDKYQCQLVFFVRDMLENSKSKEIRGTVKGLLTEEHSIFKRLAIHTINRHYGEFKDLFWNWQGNPLEEHECKHELYQLLKANCSSFSKPEINRVLEWIESKNYGDYDEDRADKALAYYKKEWLLALLETEDPDIKTIYEKYNTIEPSVVEHPGFRIWSEGPFRGDVSPIQPDELLKKSNEEIANYLKKWREEEGWKRPSKDGLSDCLKQCIAQNPNKFTKNMEPFLGIQRVYQQSLLRGFCEIRNAAEISWKDVLEFITKIVESNRFWDEKYEKQSYNYRDWMISTIADLIEKGANYEGNIFGDLLPQVGKILLTLVEKTKAEPPQMKRLVDHVLNSPKGKIFSAIIHYSLCYSHLRKDKKVRWPKAVRKDFTKRLDRNNETSLDYSVTLGMYLGNILYLDRKWVFDNIEKIFLKENATHWNAAFEGYLSYSQHVYQETYQLLRGNGHYSKALETEFSDDYVTEKLVQHICIGFIEDWEKLDEPESLVCLLLNKGNTTHLSEIIHFMWSIKDEESCKKVKESIKPLWKTMFDLLEKHQGEREYQSVISKLYLWLDIVDEIDDEIKPWVNLTAKYVGENYNGSDLVERLAKHVEKSPENVGEIYIEMLNGGVYPDYDEKDIRKVVECLYQSGFKENADMICNMYGRIGSYFLRNLYESHNDKKESK